MNNVTKFIVIALIAGLAIFMVMKYTGKKAEVAPQINTSAEVVQTEVTTEAPAVTTEVATENVEAAATTEVVAADVAPVAAPATEAAKQ